VESSPTSTTWQAGTGQSEFSSAAADPSAPMLQQTRDKAAQMVDQARGQVMSQIDSQKARAAGSLGSVAQALRQAGEQLHAQDQAPFGQVAEQAADAVERISGFLDSRNARQLLNEAEHFARSQPALFVGGAFALGLLAARFFKSSADGSQSMTGNRFADLQPSSYLGTQPSSAWATAPSVTSPSARFDAAGTTTGSVTSGIATPSSTVVTDGVGTADTEDDEDVVPALGQPSATRFSDDA